MASLFVDITMIDCEKLNIDSHMSITLEMNCKWEVTPLNVNEYFIALPVQ